MAEINISNLGGGGGGTLTLTTTGTGGASTYVAGVLNIPVYQSALTNPVTGTGTATRVAFWDSASSVSSSSNLYWNNTNSRLGIGTGSTPAAAIDILPPVQTGTGSSLDCLRVGYSNSTVSVTNSAAFQVQVAASSSNRFQTTLRLSGGSDTSQAFVRGFDSSGNGICINRARVSTGIIGDNGVVIGNNAFAGADTTPSAMLHIRSTSSAGGSALIVQNPTTTILEATNTGILRVRGSSLNLGTDNNVNLGPTTDGSTFVSSGNDILFASSNSGATNQCASFSMAGSTKTNTSGTSGLLAFTSGSYTASSGTGNYNMIGVLSNIVINQTGGTGIVRGLYLNPTLTAAVDYRGIETNNNTGYQAYFGGSGNILLGDACDIEINTTTGTKIGTATTQKIGFYNAAPIERPGTGVAEAAFVENAGGTAVNDDSTFGGYTLQQVVQALQNLGLLA